MTLEPLPAARERTIDALSRHFAEDHITLEELERRLERAYRAGSSAELEQLTHDLPALGAATAAPARGAYGASGRDLAPASGLAPGTRRMLSIMSSNKRVGNWNPPRELDVAAVMSETVLDLTGTRMQPVMDIKLFAMMASVRIIVPEGTQVEDGLLSIMAEVRNAALMFGEDPGAPIVRIRGTALMAEVVVQVEPRRA